MFESQFEESEPLIISIDKTPIKTEFTDIKVSSEIIVTGSIFKPQLGGEVFISEGSIFAKRANNSEKTDSARSKPNTDTEFQKNRRWCRQPLVELTWNDPYFPYFY